VFTFFDRSNRFNKRVTLGAIAFSAVAVFSAATVAKPGDLDTTYDSDGIATTTSLLPRTAFIEAIVVGDDSRFFLPCRQTVSAVNYDNVCELWISSAGAVVASSGAPAILTNLSVSGVHSHAVDPRNGNVVLATRCQAPGMANEGYCIMRYNADGGLDNSFNNNNRFLGFRVGSSALPMGNPGQVHITHDGRIRIAGSCPVEAAEAGVRRACVIGLTAAGTPDATFKNGTTDGLVTLPPISAVPGESARDLLIRPDGSIVVLGSCSVGSNTFGCLGILAANGTVSANWTAFNFSGFDRDFPERLFAVAPNQFVVAGFAYPTSSASFPDAFYQGITYSGGSVSLLPGWGNASASRFNGAQFRYGIKFLFGHDRNVYEVSWSGGDSTTTFASVRRINGDGTGYDLGFGNDITGVAQISNQQTRPGAGVAMRPDGKLVIGGANFVAPTQFLSARFKNGLTNQNVGCTLDIDGDGRFLSTTDGLLAARIANGNTGTATTQNAIGANAARNNWAAIRDHLFYRCGIRLAP
jgi:hypothetical protein